MIDTIRFKIPVSPAVFQLIKSKSKQKFEVNTVTQKLEFNISTKDIEIGSYDYHINIIATRTMENCIFLEFSIPKVFYGHNIYLYYPPIEPILKIIHTAIEETFTIVFPHYDAWIIQRLDISYAWRLRTQGEAYVAFLVLNPFSFSRKDKITHDTSFEEKGTSYDFIGYLKYEEFKKHDFKRFKKLKKINLAYDFLHLAKGVFRIELQLKKKKLMSYFKKEITYKDINDISYLQHILREHFSKYLKQADTKVIRIHEALLKLSLEYKPSKALQLYNFYQIWHHPNPSIRAKNRREHTTRLHPSTLSRKHKALKKAKVGIPNHEFKFNFDFSIPSKHVVNSYNLPPTQVAEEKKK